MSASAWSALADRFAILAAEQEFEFNTYPISNPAARGAGAEPFRQRFVHPFGGPPSAPTRVGAVVGSGPVRPGEFARLNRFRWLSWAAGMLLGTDSTTPAELCWYRHVHDGRAREGAAPGLTTVSALVGASAGAAHQLASAGPQAPSATPSRTPDNWPAFQREFRVLRERFNSPQWHTARPDVALTGFPDHSAQASWGQANIERSMPGPTEPRAWCSRGNIWGDTEAVNGFVDLAHDAGTALPLDLSFTPPLFPSANWLANTHPLPYQWWLEFLFLTCPSSFTLQDDTPAPGSRVARLNSSAFYVSVNAIDRMLGETGPEFLRQFRAAAAQFNPWFGDEDRSAASAAIEAVANRETAPAPRAPHRAVHWTEYPERVERFGDLLSILESLHRDRNQLDFESFANETLESAYSVELEGSSYRFEPRLDRMPALDRLLAHFDCGHLLVLNLDTLRVIQLGVARTLKIEPTSVGVMTFVQLADTLDEAARGVPTTPPPGETPAPAGPYTLNDIRDLLRYRRAHAAYSERLQAVNPADVATAQLGVALGIRTPRNLNLLLSLQEPQRPRMTEDEAATQSVYHWLVRAARADNVELDEETLRLLVGRVAMAKQRAIPDLMGLPLDEFDRVRSSIPGEVSLALDRAVPTTVPSSPSGATPPANLQPPGVAADIDSATWNLSNIFTQAIDLAESLEGDHDRGSASGDPDRIVFQLRRSLNPREWPFRFRFQTGRDGSLLPGWLESIRVATCLCADTKRVLESLAILACDVDGAIESFPGDPEEPDDTQYVSALAAARRRLRYARSLFGPSAAALWVVMTGDERGDVADHVREKARRLFGWTQMPTEIPAGLQRYHDGGRTFDDGGPKRDYRLWRTVHLELPTEDCVIPTLPVGDAHDAGGIGGQLAVQVCQLAQPAGAERKERRSNLTDRRKLILTEMLAIGAVGNTKKTTRNGVVQRIDKKRSGADFARDFGALKDANYTDSDSGPEGGVWLTGKGKTKAEELRKENEQ